MYVIELLSTVKAQSECFSVVCMVRMELQGSTTAVETGRVCLNAELQLRLFAIIDRETFYLKGDELRISSPSKPLENQESPKTCAQISQFQNSAQEKVNDLLSNGVVSTDIVIGSIFLACNQLLSEEELEGGTSENFINDIGF